MNWSENLKAKLLASITLALLVSACSNDTPPLESSTPDSAAAPAQKNEGEGLAEIRGPQVAPEGDTGTEFLASQGVALEFPHQINYDILDMSRNGTPRHRVLVEVLGGDFAQASAGFSSSLEKIGYRKAGETIDGQRIEQTFVQEGKPTYYLLIQPAGSGPQLGNPDAVGSIHIMWNKK